MPAVILFSYPPFPLNKLIFFLALTLGVFKKRKNRSTPFFCRNFLYFPFYFLFLRCVGFGDRQVDEPPAEERALCSTFLFLCVRACFAPN